MKLNPVQALRNLDEIVLDGTQKVVDKAYKQGYDKWDLATLCSKTSSISFLGVGIYDMILGYYTDNGTTMGAGALIAAIAIATYKPYLKKIEDKRNLELKLMENGCAVSQKDSKASRVLFLSIGISGLAYESYCLISGQEIPIITPDGITYPEEVQTAGKLAGTFVYLYYIFDTARNYLESTIGKPPIKDRKPIYQRIKEKVLSLLPQPTPQPIPIPVNND
ncbi:MAG: hypothetical protein Q8Q01_05370 [archaeon]|nr:hypothetical protein [archaeon]